MAKQNNKLKTMTSDELRPFMGLRSFEEKNKSQFGGRDQEITELFELVDDFCLTVVFGKSGIGKTSLLKAGLIPQLRKKFYLPIYVRIDFNATKTPLIQLRERVYEDMHEMDPDIEELGERSLWEYLQDVDFFKGRVTPVLILDQFEEIFTLGYNNMKSVMEFVLELADLAENRIPAKVKEQYRSLGKTVPSRYNKLPYRLALSLREDYLARLEELKQHMPSIMDNRFRVVQMTITQAMDAAIKPGKGLLNEAVAKEIIKTLPGVSQTDFDLLQEKGDADQKLKVEPFLLSLICDRLNEKRIEQQQDVISLELVSQFNVSDVINSFYHDTTKKYGHHVEHAIEDLLLTEGGFRKLQALGELQKQYEISDQVIDELVGARILRKEIRDGVDYVELIHDVLAPVIKKKRDERKEWEREEERVALIEFERAKTRKKRRRIGIIVGITLILAVGIAITSSLIVYNNNKRIQSMAKARGLLSHAQSQYKLYEAHEKVATLSVTAYKIFDKNSLDEIGENVFDRVYYNKMLQSLANINLNVNKRISKKVVLKFPDLNRSIPDSVTEEYAIKGLIYINSDDEKSAGRFYVGRRNGEIDLIRINAKSGKSRIDPTKFKLSPNKYGLISMTHNNGKYLAITTKKSKSISIFNLELDTLHEEFTSPLIKGKKKKIIHYSSNGDLILQQDNSIYGWRKELKFPIKWNKRKQWLWDSNNGPDNKSWTKQAIKENDSSAVIWNKDVFQIPGELKHKGQSDPLKKLSCFSIADDSKMAIGYRNGLAILTEKELIQLNIDNINTIRAIKFSPNGKFLILGNNEGKVFSIRITENDDGIISDLDINELPFEHSKAVIFIEFDANITDFENTSFATVDREGLVVKWSRNSDVWSALPLDTGEISKTMVERFGDDVDGSNYEIKDSGIWGIAFTSDGRNIITAYGDKEGTMYKWPASMKELSNTVIYKLEENLSKYHKDFQFGEEEWIPFGLSNSHQEYYSWSLTTKEIINNQKQITYEKQGL